MQGISQSKHRHLVNALLQLEELLGGDFIKDKDKHLAAALRENLETIMAEYEKQVTDLAELITDYHELFHKAKVQFLSPKLKELRKVTECDVKVFPLIAKHQAGVWYLI